MNTPLRIGCHPLPLLQANTILSRKLICLFCLNLLISQDFMECLRARPFLLFHQFPVKKVS